MYAKHLMGVSARKPDPVYVFGNPADYVASPSGAGTVRRVVYDTQGRIVFSAPTTGPTQTNASGRVSKDGTTALAVTPSPNPDSVVNIQLWSTDNHGVSTLRRVTPIPAAHANAVVATEAGAYAATNGTIFGNVQKFVYADLASGAAYADPTGYQFGRAVLMASREAVYLQPDYTADLASSDPRVFLTASNGRANRCRILPVDHSLKRFVSRYTLNGLVDLRLTPWRRPLTTATKCRAYNWFNGVGDSVRAGKLFRRVTIQTHEIEIGASQGIVVVNGLRFTRHTLSYYTGAIFGVVRLTVAAGAEIITTGQQLSSVTWTVLQYLDAGDAPSNEYIIEANGNWISANDSQLVTTSSGHTRKPAVVAMNNIVVATTDNRLALYDLAGNFVKVTKAPGGTIAADWMGNGPSVPTDGLDNAYFHLQSHDLIVKATGYNTVVPATFDLGETWVNTYIPSNPSAAPPAGYTPPASSGVPVPTPVAPPAQQGNAFLIGMSAWQPLFIT